MGHLVDSFHLENTNSLFICLNHLLGQVIFQNMLCLTELVQEHREVVNISPQECSVKVCL